MPAAEDARWLAAAAALAERARPLSRPNPGVGAIIVNNGRVIGRGWTQSGGRPHAEAVALAAAGDAASGGALYVTLEPCAHRSERGPACADLVAEARLGKVVIGMRDPDPRTAGKGIAMLEDAGVEVRTLDLAPGVLGLSGHQARCVDERPHVTLKLALSVDGCIATSSGESQWITGEQARAHGHRERARADAILVGGETLRADNPALNVRLPGLAYRSPERWVLTRGAPPEGWRALSAPEGVKAMERVNYLFVEGGAATAEAFLAHDLVDRLLIYRAPIILGEGKQGIGDIGLASLSEAHGRWKHEDSRQLGADTLEIYSRTR